MQKECRNVELDGVRSPRGQHVAGARLRATIMALVTAVRAVSTLRTRRHVTLRA